MGNLRFLRWKCFVICVPGLILLLKEAITLTQSRILGLTLRYRPEMIIINLILNCCFQHTFCTWVKEKKARIFFSPLSSTRGCQIPALYLDRSIALFFLPLLSKQWSFIHYSAIRDCQDFLAVELGSSYISLKMWKNVFAKLLEREMKKDINSCNIINPCISPRGLTWVFL